MELVTDEISITDHILSKFDGITQDERSVHHLWNGMGFFYEVGGGLVEDEFDGDQYSSAISDIPEEKAKASRLPREDSKPRVRVISTPLE